MKLKPGLALLISLVALSISSCSKKDTFITDTPAEYYPLQVGRYIIYRMDSLKYTNVGSQETITS